MSQFSSLSFALKPQYLDLSELFPVPGITIIQRNGPNNTVTGTDGSDTIFANYGGTVNGGDGADTIYASGATAQLVIDGGRGADTIYAGSGNDSIDGGAGADYIDGGAGNDWLRGGTGSDRILGGAGSDACFGGTGNDVLMSGGSAAGSLFNGDTDHALRMVQSAHFAELWDQADVLVGGRDNDQLVLQGGNVLAYGGDYEAPYRPSGSDTFTCYGTNGIDEYYINVGIDGGRVDMRALGAAKAHYVTVEDDATYDIFLFGTDTATDTVVIEHTANSPVTFIF